MRAKFLGVLVLFVPIVARAQPLPRDTTINVSVSRSGRAVADRMVLFVAVEALAETPQAATDRLQVKLKAVQDSIHKVSPTAVMERPISYGVNPSSNNGYPPPTSPLFAARAAVRTTVSKLAELSTLQAAASAAGAVATGGYVYESSSVDSVWRAKLTEAVQMAREMAELSAKAQGFQLGSLISMTTSGGGQNQGFNANPQISFDARNQNSYVTVTDITVSISVSAQYKLIRK